MLDRVYKEELGWLQSAEEGLKDRYHGNSQYICAFDGFTPVGALRVVHDSAAGLPIEQFTDLRSLILGKAVELQRFAVVPEWRVRRVDDAPFGVGTALYRAALRLCAAENVETMVADVFLNTATTPIPFLRSMGFEQQPILFQDTELAHEGESSVMLARVRDILKLRQAGSRPLDRYLTEA
ncbi:N-acyl amino acid synthase FeeM domain-containing protein [Streptomyces sp. NPDC085932]|uniref:N-acyl amino acid synthase FeeM domain-containing protein n=1 Tax=Streptomyces sp. NPDC085932 TaxID=3365741 RepID=UPI0037D0D1E9